MSKIEKRVIVNGSIERLFTYVPEIDDSPELWPGLLEVGEVQHLPRGGVLARWLYKLSGAIYEDLDERCEPLVDRNGALATLGDVNCAMKWHFQAHTHTPGITLSGDYTYWSMC